MLLGPNYRLVTAKEFLEFSFSDRKAELDRGQVRVLDGVTIRHAMVQGNLLAWFHASFRGGRKWSVYGSGMLIRTGSHSVRVADLAVYPWRDGPEHDDDPALDDPRVIFEIVSDQAPRTNLAVKLAEYRELPSVTAIVLVNIATERVRIIWRTGPLSWSDQGYDDPVDVALPSLDLVIPHSEIFARD